MTDVRKLYAQATRAEKKRIADAEVLAKTADCGDRERLDEEARLFRKFRQRAREDFRFLKRSSG